MLARILAVALARVGKLGRIRTDIFDVAVDHAVFVERKSGELDLDLLVDLDPAGIFVGDPDFRFHGVIVRDQGHQNRTGRNHGSRRMRSQVLHHAVVRRLQFKEVVLLGLLAGKIAIISDGNIWCLCKLQQVRIFIIQSQPTSYEVGR